MRQGKSAFGTVTQRVPSDSNAVAGKLRPLLQEVALLWSSAENVTEGCVVSAPPFSLTTAHRVSPEVPRPRSGQPVPQTARATPVRNSAWEPCPFNNLIEIIT